VRVDVTYEYDVVFGLAPVLQDRIQLHQSHTERIIDPFDRVGGGTNADPIVSTNTPTETSTPRPSDTPTSSPTDGPSPTATHTHTPGPSPTATATATHTGTPTPGASPTATHTHTPGPSPTQTNTPTEGPSPTATDTPTNTPTNTPTPEYVVAITFPGDTEAYVPGPDYERDEIGDRVFTYTEDGEAAPVLVDTVDMTAFGAIAYNRNAILNGGDTPPARSAALSEHLAHDGTGVATVEFQIVRPNGTTFSPSFIDSSAAYCFFGGNGPCDDMPNNYESQVGTVVFNEPGEYTLRARAASADSVIKSPWSERTFTIPSFGARILPAYETDIDANTFEDLPAGLLVETRDLTRFRAVAYDPDVTSGEPDAGAPLVDHLSFDGEGITAVDYELIDPLDTKILFSNDPITNDPFCIFGNSGGDCDRVDENDYQFWRSGTYTLRVRASNGFLWSDWQEITFEVPPLDIYVAYANPLTPGLSFLQREETNFQLITYDRGEVTNPPDITAPITDHLSYDGTGISEVRFKMFSPKSFEWYGSTDATSSYCLFGESGGVCDPMTSTKFGQFLSVPGIYKIQVRVKTTANARWTDWQEYETTVVAPDLACDGTTDPVIGQVGGPWSAWVATDIGAAATGTTKILSTGEMLVCGSGDDIWSDSDNFRYVYRSIPAGFNQVTARVVYFDGGSDDWSKAGLMLRSSTGVDASYGFTIVTGRTGSEGARMQWRQNNGGTTSAEDLGGYSQPLLLRLTRVSADQVQSSYSTDDGATWTTSGTRTVNNLHDFSAVGIAITSHNNNAFAKIVITDMVFE
jgi:hypothetical protein